MRLEGKGDAIAAMPVALRDGQFPADEDDHLTAIDDRITR